MHTHSGPSILTPPIQPEKKCSYIDGGLKIEVYVYWEYKEGVES